MVSPDTRLLAGDLAGSVLVASRGALRHGFVFSAYGHDPAQADIRAQLGFNGVIRELLTGCYLLGNGHRAFSPTLMRFHSPDGLSPFAAGGINAYGYCGGDPVNHVDPDGRMIKSTAEKRLKEIINNTPSHEMETLSKELKFDLATLQNTTRMNALKQASNIPTIDQIKKDGTTFDPSPLGITEKNYILLEQVAISAKNFSAAHLKLTSSPSSDSQSDYAQASANYIESVNAVANSLRQDKRTSEELS
ncbi:RHS repeat-associated core domain-containing protein [Pseudomonas sp. AA27]|uniref:RHS repeat-associated core domain-containing protein n=1 Tax=Pseudomonas sp. AA27 TaxID=2908652 RepID=UPI001F3A040F|nr:RHS repeat-associated core domain-containing protein [Pseudomonas sp. AA27]MCF1487479.1 RHS repeat-associated core domain-containing protein [Pseudomonas sp. AA27]